MAFSIGGITFGSRTIGSAEHQAGYLADSTGADAVGDVTDSPGSNTLLGRLKALLTSTGNSEPARQAFAITKSDSAAITPLPKSVRVDQAGTVVYRAVDSSSDVTIAASAGELIPVRVQYIRTSSTASGFLGYA